MKLPNFSSYGKYKYKSDNYGVNCLKFDVDGATFWFSYTTMVAFKFGNNPMVVMKNYWGPTTGKHLKWIDEGIVDRRVDRETFEKLYEEQYNLCRGDFVTK